jgi:hypothetical protein
MKVSSLRRTGSICGLLTITRVLWVAPLAHVYGILAAICALRASIVRRILVAGARDSTRIRRRTSR